MGDIDTLASLDSPRLCAIEDVGPRIAESIIDYFANPVNKEIVARLKDYGLTMAIPESSRSLTRSDKLAGKSIVISGTFSHHSRDQYKEMIEANGGKNAGSISKKTSFILAGENMGPAKLEKATALGIPLVDEDTFLDMLK